MGQYTSLMFARYTHLITGVFIMKKGDRMLDLIAFSLVGYLFLESRYMFSQLALQVRSFVLVDVIIL